MVLDEVDVSSALLCLLEYLHLARPLLLRPVGLDSKVVPLTKGLRVGDPRCFQQACLPPTDDAGATPNQSRPQIYLVIVGEKEGCDFLAALLFGN